MEIKQTILDNIVIRFLSTMNAKAVIFDLDGTLIDNNSYHLKAWRIYLKKTGIDISEEAYRKNINGKTNKDVLENIHNKKTTDEEAMVYALEKEALYREIYQSDIKPVEGLISLLETFHNRSIPMAIAT